MFKLVVLSVLLVVAAARPGHYETPVVYSVQPATYTVHEPALAHVGNIVKSVPTSVSHHSQSVVHSSAHVVQDVFAPVGVRTTSYSVAPLHTHYAAVDVAPLYKTVAATPFAYKAW